MRNHVGLLIAVWVRKESVVITPRNTYLRNFETNQINLLQLQLQILNARSLNTHSVHTPTIVSNCSPLKNEHNAIKNCTAQRFTLRQHILPSPIPNFQTHSLSNTQYLASRWHIFKKSNTLFSDQSYILDQLYIISPPLLRYRYNIWLASDKGRDSATYHFLHLQLHYRQTPRDDNYINIRIISCLGQLILTIQIKILKQETSFARYQTPIRI